MRVRHVPQCAVLCALLAVSASVAGAQPAAQPPAEATPTPQRLQLEQRVRERIALILKERLALTDEQSRRMSDLWVRLEPERRELNRDERETRAALRAELLAGSQGNEARIRELMDRVSTLDRKKLDLRDREQQELAQFLSPGQRARFFALQDELRRAFNNAQRRRLEEGAVGGGLLRERLQERRERRPLAPPL
jgi:periplasmic protein CpxP/Spy